MAISTQSKSFAGKPSARFGKFIPKVSGRLSGTIIFILAATLVASAIILWIGNRRSLSVGVIFFNVFVSFVYSTCIGGLLSIGLHLFLPRLANKNPFVKFLFLAVWISLATTIGFLLGSFALLGVNALTGTSYFDLDLVSWRVSVFMGLLFGSFAFINDSLKIKLEKTELELRTRQLSEAKAENLAVEARLSSLESRVRPHFLFNTLNSISALIRENPHQAERTVERLAALLRFSLDAANQKTVALSEEIKIIRDYLEIEKTRFGERLQFSLAIDQAAENFKIPPFALQTLIENSLKHHISNHRAGGEIRVAAQIENNFLQLEVWDDGAGFDESDISENHGLDNLQARLSALYGETANLKIERRDRFTVVSVIISATEAK